MNCSGDAIINKSVSCLADDTFDCYPYSKKISVAMGVWCIINSILGSIGNLFTLLSLGYAAKNNM